MAENKKRRLETSLKKTPLLPSLTHHDHQRAEEIEKVEPKIAYYCRMYAVEQGLALPDRSPQIDGLLGALLSKLEKDKPQLKPPPPGSDDASYCERFALSVFARADRVDRAGRADKSTSTAFYAASVFMEILNQFGPLAADVAEAQRYAAWKAADIRKALREGRRPVAGPPAGTASAGGKGESGDLDLPSPPGAESKPSPDSPSAPPPPPPPPPAAAAAAPSPSPPLPPPRFLPGARVLYCHDGHGPGVPRTVAKALPPEGLGHAFVVALSGQVVSAFDPQLCPRLEAGDEVSVRARAELERESEESGAREMADVAKLAAEEASKKKGVAGLFSKSEKIHENDEESEGPEGQGRAVVVGVDASCWRPRFTVKLLEGESGKEITITDKRIVSFPAPSSSSSSPSSAAPPPKMPKGDPPPFAAAHAPLPPAVAVSAPAATAAATTTPSAPPPPQPSSSSFSPSLQQITEAVKAAKCAVSSLQFEDVGTGVKFLREALELLTTETAKGGKKK